MKEKLAPAPRNDVIRCERCGEDYSTTYKRCPFCDERPGRTGVGQAHKNRGMHTTVTLLSLAVIASAVFVTFRLFAPTFHSKPTPQQPSASVPSASQSESTSQPAPVELTLDTAQLTLAPSESAVLSAQVDPAGTPLVWSSSDESVLTVDDHGTVTNVNPGAEAVEVTVTVSAGEQSAQCTVLCDGTPSGGVSEPAEPGPDPVNPDKPSTPGEINKLGVVVDADFGLKIRSGPGTTYPVVASAENGASILVLADEGNGWYKVQYVRGQTGYASSTYISVP